MKKKKLSNSYEPTKMDVKCAKMIRRAAFIEFKRGVAVHLADTEMSGLYVKDFMNLLRIADSLMAYGPATTSSLVCDLDTGCCETIPATAYDYIMDEK